MALGGHCTVSVMISIEPLLDDRTAAALARASPGAWEALADTFVPRHFVHWWRTRGETQVHVLSVDELFDQHAEAWANRTRQQPRHDRQGPPGRHGRTLVLRLGQSTAASFGADFEQEEGP